jgi:hypothetical protein
LDEVARLDILADAWNQGPMLWFLKYFRRKI